MKRVTSILKLTVLCIVFGSCSDKNEPIVGDGNLIVRIKAIEDHQLINAASTSGKKKASINTVEKSKIFTGNLINLGDADAIVDFGSDLPNQASVVAETQHGDRPSSRSANIGADAKLNKVANLANMNRGVKYRLLIYDKSSNLILNQVLTSGASSDIKIDGGLDLTWYAVSLNESADVPNINSSGVISKSSLINKDLLYASGTLGTKNGINYLDITFRRQTAKITMMIDVRGLFGGLEDASRVTVVKNAQNENVLQMGSLDIKTGEFLEIGPVVGTVRGADMVSIKTDPLTGKALRQNTVKTADFYTISEEQLVGGLNFNLRLDDFKIRIDDKNVRTFKLRNIVPTSFDYIPRIGTVSIVHARMIESPVKVRGLLWARSNLIFRDDAFEDNYAFRFNPSQPRSSNRDQDFWNFRSRTPRGTPSDNFDPCEQVYPKGIWRMPTKTEWEELGQPNGRQREAALWGSSDYAYEYNRDSDYPSNDAYPNNNLFFAFGGFRTEGGSYGETPWDFLGGAYAEGSCHYWSSSIADDDEGWVAKSKFTVRFWAFNWDNMYLQKGYKKQGRNIRCVRAV